MHYLSPGVDSGSSCPIEDIDCSIMVPVKNSFTERATMNLISKGLRNSFTTNTAIDACIVDGTSLDSALSRSMHLNLESSLWFNNFYSKGFGDIKIDRFEFFRYDLV